MCFLEARRVHVFQTFYDILVSKFRWVAFDKSSISIECFFCYAAKSYPPFIGSFFEPALGIFSVNFIGFEAFASTHCIWHHFGFGFSGISDTVVRKLAGCRKLVHLHLNPGLQPGVWDRLKPMFSL